MNTQPEQARAERAEAYGRVVKTLDDLSASKLHPAEQQTVRDAADALFFCEDLGGDSEAERALAALDELATGWRAASDFCPRLRTG